jgi:hypothetical protein
MHRALALPGHARAAWTAVISALALLAALAEHAHAERRVALVVGNGAYQHTVPLANPRNDAQDIAAALGELGFEVISGTDLDKRSLDLKVREFARALEGADVGLFFYAGHGLQVKGINYLVATDAKLEAERDLDFDAVRVEFVLAQMEREAKTNIVFLDACRNNPLARNLARSMGTRGVAENNGLAPIKSGLGTFIAFATEPGNVASDGSGRNSPFTAALKDHIDAPGASITDVLIDVRKDVVEATKGDQVPWDHSALRGRFYFNAAIQESPPQASTPAEPTRPISEASREWSRVDKTSLAELETYLRRHGSSPEADYARSRMAALKKAAKEETCNVDGHWEQTATDVGISTWILTRSGDDRYHAQENGMGNAVGTAVMIGNRVRIDWRTGDFSGIYEWVIDPSCTAGEGQLVFYSGGTGTHRSVARRVTAAPLNKQ